MSKDEVKLVVTDGEYWDEEADEIIEYTAIAWKAYGSDGKQYGDYLATTRDPVGAGISEAAHQWAKGSMSKVSPVAHLIPPSASAIESRLLDEMQKKAANPKDSG